MSIKAGEVLNYKTDECQRERSIYNRLWKSRSIGQSLVLGLVANLAVSISAEGFSLLRFLWVYYPAPRWTIGWIAAIGVALFLGYLRCIGRFLLLENVLLGRYAQDLSSRLNRQAPRLFIFSFFVVLAMQGMPLIVAQGLDLRKVDWSNPAFHSLTLIALLFSMPNFMLLSFFMTLCDEMLVPVMYNYNCGSLQGCLHVLQLIKSRPKIFICWLVIRMILGALWGAIVLMATMVTAKVTGAPWEMTVKYFEHGATPGLSTLLPLGIFVILLLPQVLIVNSIGAVLTSALSIHCIRRMDKETVTEGTGLTADSKAEAEPNGG